MVAGQSSSDGTRVGLDLVDVDRFRRALARHPGLEARLFTPTELAYCHGRARPELHLAARFAAKEAVGKLLETGVLSWQEIEVVCERVGGPPSLRLSGRTAERAAELAIASVRVSLSHVDSLAGACVAAVACSSRGEHNGRLIDG
jgi:holo-[acyl-carrier protein] synthase